MLDANNYVGTMLDLILGIVVNIILRKFKK